MAELSQDVRAGSVALLAIDQQRAVLFVDMQVISLAAQGAGSGNMSARLCFRAGQKGTNVVQVQLGNFRTGCLHL